MRVLILLALSVSMSAAQPSPQAEITPQAAQDNVDALWRHIVEELYDHHAYVTTNTPESTHLVPSGADI